MKHIMVAVCCAGLLISLVGDIPARANDDLEMINYLLRSLELLSPGSPLFKARVRLLVETYEQQQTKKGLSPYGNHNLSVMLSFLGNHGLALKYEKSAAFWRPGEMVFQLGLFKCHMALGEYEKALEIFQRIREGLESGSLTTTCRKPPGYFEQRIKDILEAK